MDVRRMKILTNREVPTGNILIVEGSKGKLEMLSLQDYGKVHNIKADFLGFTDKITHVPHQEMLPLEEKWVVTISTQYGCSMNCMFCDVSKVGTGVNATFFDLIKQVLTALKLHPEVTSSKRLNIHFARMGEPTWNPNVLDATKWLKEHVDPEFKIHPVVSTMMPKNNIWLKTFIHAWMRMKNRLLRGEAGLQLSINSTNEKTREKMFRGNSMRFIQMKDLLRGIVPSGRKITLNFAVNETEWIEPNVLLDYFDPDNYLVKITPFHATVTGTKNGYKPISISSYDDIYDNEQWLIDAGYDVIIFIPSKEEDESKITCGNAILSERMNNDT